MSTSRTLHKSFLLPDGSVLILGGYDRNSASITTPAERYNPTSQTWSSVSVSSFSGKIVDATSLANGDVLVTGGMGFDPIHTSAAIYHSVGDTWLSVIGVPEDWNPFNLHTNGTRHGRGYGSVLLQDGRVLVMGGEADSGVPSAAVTLFDPLTRSWIPRASQFHNGVDFTATLLPQGQVLVVGGRNPDAIPNYRLEARLYDPELDVWTPAGSLATPRVGHTATLLPDGSVIVIGGGGENQGSDSVERLARGSGTWVPIGTLLNARAGHTATLLANGAVLVAGGGGGAKAELWR